MAKKQNKPTKTCADCIHVNACRAWVDRRYIADESANRCPNYETGKERSAYLCGVLDERKLKKTNADRIRSMTNEELKEFICSLLQCKFCEFELWGRCELLKWLQKPAEETERQWEKRRKY